MKTSESFATILADQRSGRAQVASMSETAHRSASAFSLIELLVVIAIIGLLASVTIPAYKAIASAGSMSGGAHDVAALLELARSEAVARQTYVWLGVTPTNESGSSLIHLAAVYSLDGTSTNTASNNLAPLTKVVFFRDVMLTNWNALKAETRARYTDGVTTSVAGNSSGVQFDVGRSHFSGSTITFTPRGEALLKGKPGPYDGYDARLEITLQQAHGTTVASQADDVAIVIDGATGVPAIVQLQ